MINFCCVYYGNKYHVDYVQTLYNMVQRNLTIPHQFYCFTDHVNMFDKVYGNIIYKDFPLKGYEGWWNKLQLFHRDVGLEGVNLYMDLDMVLLKNIDEFATYGNDESFSIINDFSTKTVFNSSILKWNNKTASYIWDEYDTNLSDYVLYPSDQEVITDLVKGKEFLKVYPDEWTFSYKWYTRTNPKYKQGEQTYEQDQNAKVAVFHGKPDPHEAKQQWVIDHWK